MNKRFLMFLILFLQLSVISCQSFDLDLIKIEATTEVTIGTNQYYYYKDLYRKNPIEKAYYYPERKIELESYVISKYLVTDKLFNQFLEETGFQLIICKEFPFLEKYFSSNKESNKIFGFSSYFESLCFCNWLSNKTKKTFRFPTNAEWEYACVEDEKNQFPFGAPKGVFTSIENEADTRCIYLTYNQVKEDYSSKDIYSVYGSSQYILDSFDKKTYLDIKEKTINPLVLSNSNIFNTRSGETEYNSNNETEWGLLLTGNTSFYTNNGDCYTTIRLVLDEGTIFNKNTEFPFVYYQKVGQCMKSFSVYDENGNNIGSLNSSDEVLILYKSLNNLKYFIFFKNNNSWSTAWVDVSDITILKKNWYEIER